MGCVICNWNCHKVQDGPINFKICRSDNCNRLDIRRVYNNKPSKFGVSLTPSEFKFVLNYYKSFNSIETDKTFYDVIITKNSKTSFQIKKKDSHITTTLKWWEEIEPYAFAAIFLVSQELPINQLLDLYLLSLMIPEKDLLAMKFDPVKGTRVDPDKCYLYNLALVSKEDIYNRKIDTGSVIQFANIDPDTYRSLVRLQYK